MQQQYDSLRHHHNLSTWHWKPEQLQQKKYTDASADHLQWNKCITKQLNRFTTPKENSTNLEFLMCNTLFSSEDVLWWQLWLAEFIFGAESHFKLFWYVMFITSKYVLLLAATFKWNKWLSWLTGYWLFLVYVFILVSTPKNSGHSSSCLHDETCS